MTKTVKKLLICLMAFVMTVCSGIALLGTQPITANAETETHSHCACGTTHQAIGSHTDEEEITWTPWDGTTEYKASGVTSYVYLSDDVVLDEAIYVDKNYTLYFCLNGKKLTAKSTGFRAFSVWGGGTLILTDCGTNVRQGYIDAKTHLWTDGEANVSEGDIEYNITGGVIAGFDYSSEGGSIYVSKGKLYTYGVNICGNKTSSNDYGGGAIYISTDSTAELNNTTISGNVSPSIGSGLVAANNAMVTMNKCTFNNNLINAPNNKYPDGGCVSVNKNSTKTATLTMKNCVLENNSSINRGYTAMTVNGIANLEDCEIINNKGFNGAIFVPSQGQLNLKNTTIKNNISNGGSAGGIYCRNSTINLSGRIVIADNTSSESNTYNVYVDGSDFKINIVGDGLEEGSLIGIFPNYFTYGQVANHTNFVLVSQNDVDYSSCFISDRPESYHVEYNSDGNIIITNGKTEIYTVTFDVNGVECTAPTAQTINVGGKAKQPTLSNVDGYNVVGWYTDSACTNEFSFDTAITEDITLYAKWGICYDVWVAGIQLDSTNTTIDGNDNSAIAGSATYDAENNILTLDNFSYTGAGYIFDDWFNNSAIIFAKNELTVKLVGTNVITTTEDRCFDIVSYDLLTITSDTEDKTDGVLTTTCEFCAINVGSLSISNVTINATGLGAISVEDGATIINNAIINAIGTSEEALLVHDILKVENSSLTLESQVGTALDSYKWDDAFFTIKNSTLTINSQSKGINCSFIDVSNSTIEISAVNEAMYDPIWGEGCVPSFFDSHAVYAGDDSASATLIAEPDYTTYENKYVKIVPAYDIWVAGIRLNAENFIIDNNDDSTIKGSATYDPTSNTLTLDNFKYESIGDYRGNNDYEPIRVKDGTTINVVGNNDIACNALSDDNYYAIYGLGSLTIIGNGDTDILYTHGYDGGGIYSSGTLTIQNLKLAVHANQSAIHSKKEITLDKVSGEIYSWLEDGIYVSDFSNSVNILNCNLLIEGYRKGITANYSVVYFENSFVEICSQDGYALWDNDRNAIAYVSYKDKPFVFAGWYEEEAEEVDPYDTNSFKNNYVKIVPTRKVTLNFSSVGLPSEEVFVIVNATAIIETPVIDGYVFIGWYNEDTLETAFDFSTPITENITIYAKFANYTQDMADINSQINGVKDSINSLQSSINDGKADATELANNVTDLQGKINALTNNYQSADATQQVQIDALESQVENLITNAIAVLNGKVTGIESEIANINGAISTNAGDIIKNADKITSLTTQLTALQGLANSLSDTYIDNGELAKLKAELVGVDNQIKGLIETLTAKVTDIESKIANINSAISTNASGITTNADKITSLTTQLTALQGLANNLSDTYIDNTELSSLKAELVGVDNQIKGLIETLTAKVTGIESEIANINSAISTNAGGITANADKITSLTTQLTALQGLANSLGDTYIDNTELSSLKAELVGVDTEIKGLIETLTARVTQTESDIASLVSNKADVTLVTEKVEELKGLINSLDAVKNNYSTADEELKNQLTTAINNAKQQAIDSATELVNTAKSELNAAIALKADTATVTAKFKEVESAIDILQELSDDYVSADSALKEELTSLIVDTKEEIIELILAGDKANAEALEKEIAKLREEIGKAGTNAKVLPTVIASAAVAGNIALALWLIIKRRTIR